MTTELMVLLATAISLGVLHTALGPDHYLPFIVMSRAGRWSLGRTLCITLACGLAHVGSSLVLGVVGMAVGVSVANLEELEGSRGTIAAWLLITFGLLYFIWGARQAQRSRIHRHAHFHGDGRKHLHEHNHQTEHLHDHGSDSQAVTPWLLFTIFIFGPCEVLIPMLLYPAARLDWMAVGLVTLLFGIATIVTMLGIVWAGVRGLGQLASGRLERYAHAVAGLTVCLCGVAIKFLGV